MSSSTETTALAVTYTAFILGAMYWSSLEGERTIYNRYVVLSEGVTIPVSDIGRTENLLRKVLSFRDLPPNSPAEPQSNTMVMPGNRGVSMHLTQSPTPLRPSSELPPTPGAGASAPKPETPAKCSGTPEVSFRVRNGFERLQREFRSGITHFLGQNPPPAGARIPAVTDIVTVPGGQEFAVEDYDCNRFVFFSPARASSHRN